jgi:hypothetical protein
MESAAGQRRQDSELIICGHEGFYRHLGEIERAQWPGWDPIATRKGAKASYGIPDRCRASKLQLQALAPQSFRVAPEQQNLDGERGGGSCGHT